MQNSISNLSDSLLKHVKTSDKVCPIHETPLSVFKELAPFCQQCKKEQIENKNNEMVKVAEERHAKRTTVEVLKKDSVLYDDTISNACFRNYSCVEDSKEYSVKQEIEALGKKYLEGEKFNAIFNGEPGAGKSHLAMSLLKVLNEYSNEPVSCLFISFEEVLSLIRESYNNPETKYSELNMIDLMGRVDYLVLDDVGSETGRLARTDGRTVYATDFTVKVLKRTLERRQNKSTIVTTNLTKTQLATIYDARIASRIYRNVAGNIVKFHGISDKRVKSL
ncbi:ATP-binding protein [Carnobacterium divergens]|uniref:ATP-binding protein n=1 Tax=Carnobacterium divergens TaxID=2748 RepID=UPI0028921B96|nr:ATP-binding protein [Carnobacterium divergens]MDT1997249.1 ATP-binding protein [Carnobacterium divergens]